MEQHPLSVECGIPHQCFPASVDLHQMKSMCKVKFSDGWESQKDLVETSNHNCFDDCDPQLDDAARQTPYPNLQAVAHNLASGVS